MPKWLAPALGQFDVFALNIKGVKLDDTICCIRLSKLEELVERAVREHVT
jgi:hypothetical protein